MDARSEEDSDSPPTPVSESEAIRRKKERKRRQADKLLGQLERKRQRQVQTEATRTQQGQLRSVFESQRRSQGRPYTYLRRHFFPLHPDLKYAGVLNPTDMPHHLRATESSPFREGVVLDRPPTASGSLVNVGLTQDVIIDKTLTPGVRVTVQLDQSQVKAGRTRVGRVVSPAYPRTQLGLYWGYTVRLAQSLTQALNQGPYRGGYDLKLGTSERGQSVDEFEFPAPFQHLLVVLGGVKGLERAVATDERIQAEDPSELFDHYLNTCPLQGSRTIRTEEALLITLAGLRPKIAVAIPLCSYLSTHDIVDLYLIENSDTIDEIRNGRPHRRAQVPSGLLEPRTRLKCSGVFARHWGDLSLALLNPLSGVCVIVGTDHLQPVKTLAAVRTMVTGDFNHVGYRQIRFEYHGLDAESEVDPAPTNGSVNLTRVLKAELEQSQATIEAAQQKICALDVEIERLCWRMAAVGVKIPESQLISNVIGRCGENPQVELPTRLKVVQPRSPYRFLDWLVIPMQLSNPSQDRLTEVHFKPCTLSPMDFIIVWPTSDGQKPEEVPPNASITAILAIPSVKLLAMKIGQKTLPLSVQFKTAHTSLQSHLRPLKVDLLKVGPGSSEDIELLLPFLRAINLHLLDQDGANPLNWSRVLLHSGLQKSSASEFWFHDITGPLFVEAKDASLRVFGTMTSVGVFLRKFFHEMPSDFPVWPHKGANLMLKEAREGYIDQLRRLKAVLIKISRWVPKSRGDDAGSSPILDRARFKARQEQSNVHRKGFHVDLDDCDDTMSSRRPTEPCFFGKKCFRKNPLHFKEYAHPHLDRILEQWGNGDLSLQNNLDVPCEVLQVQFKILRELFPELKPKTPVPGSSKDIAPPPAKRARPPDSSSSSKAASSSSKKLTLVQRKLEASAPFNMFLTKVKDSTETHRDLGSLYFSELLHPSLGTLKSSLQINFMVEWDWLKMNYEETRNEDKPMLLIYGEENPDLSPNALPKHVRAIRVKPRYPFGTHHTKMMLLQYADDSIRVVVSTANLVSSDWLNRTQGLWVSPRCPSTASADTGDSKTHFKTGLLRYLQFYELSPLREYTEVVKKCDFSEVNVFFIGSVPNSHKGPDLNHWGQRAVANRLKQSIKSDIEKWPLIIQCSSIGSLGPQESSWMRGDLAQSLCSTSRLTSGSLPNVQVVYPSQANVMQSYDGILGGGCLPYAQKTHQKQPWLRQFLHEWKSDRRHRSRAMPHIKSYTRVNPEGTRAAYYLLTSANLSKAAWGSFSKGRDSLMIMSYEAGVLFVPKFVTGEEFFDLTGDKSLPLPYDMPLTRYGPDQDPWFMDYLRAALAN
eukprot:maker-scaffold1541_size36691-snap-gene-0.12 protein:Tk04158 transcript:maker-scaffold1541_size36691-snap-gene-0.12-mRNA-1 annotation:"tyrosyl-dna phosphodiesterase"